MPTIDANRYHFEMIQLSIKIYWSQVLGFKQVPCIKFFVCTLWKILTIVIILTNFVLHSHRMFWITVSILHFPCMNNSCFVGLTQLQISVCTWHGATRKNLKYQPWVHSHMMTSCDISFLDALIARFMRPTWGPSGADRTQVGPMLVPWTLLSGCLLLRDS